MFSNIIEFESNMKYKHLQLFRIFVFYATNIVRVEEKSRKNSIIPFTFWAIFSQTFSSLSSSKYEQYEHMSNKLCVSHDAEFQLKFKRKANSL